MSTTKAVPLQPTKAPAPWASEPFTLIRLPRVRAKTALSRSTIYARVAAGLLPRPVSLGGRAVAWPAREVEIVNAGRIAGMDDEAIRALVTELAAARGAAGRAAEAL